MLKSKKHPMSTMRMILADCRKYQKYLCNRYRHNAKVLLTLSTMSVETSNIFVDAMSKVGKEIQACNRIIYCYAQRNTNSYCDAYSPTLRDDYYRSMK